MITKFKLYESINEGEPMVGDYIICKIRPAHEDTHFQKYVENNVGKIVTEFNDSTYFYGKDIKNYIVKFTNSSTYPFNKEHILYWSKNKEDMEDILQAKNYNL